MASDPEAVKQRRADNLRKAREAKQRKAIEQHQSNIPPAKEPEPKHLPPPPPQDEERQEDYDSEPSIDSDDLDLELSDSELEEPVRKKKGKSKVPVKTKSKLTTKPVVVASPKKVKRKQKPTEPPPKKRKRDQEEDSESEEEQHQKQPKKKSKKDEPNLFQKLYAKAESLDLSDEAINYLGTVVGILGVLVYIRNRPTIGTVGKNGVIANAPPYNPSPTPQETRGNYYTPAAEIGQPVLYR